MAHTIREADRLGLEVCYHQCAGWSSSGGPWITPEYAMQTVLTVEKQISGGEQIQITLPRPEKLRNDYFRDIAVLAFPTPASEQNGKPGFRVDNWRSKAGFERDNAIQKDSREVDAKDRIQLNAILNLSDKMNADGQLTWDAPAGKWTVVRFGHGVGGTRNRPAPREGRGNECDKMSKAAAEWHWKHTVQKIIDDVGPLTGKAFRSVLIDSYETGQQNWTVGLDAEFQKRMGYALIAHLPALTGRVVNDVDYTERFLWDFRRVLADMWTENYFGHFAKMCHDNGLLLANEPYGVPGNMDDFAVADVADIPMGEWWARTLGGPFISSSKLASSAAHTNGRRFVGAEAFTAGQMDAAFVNHPYKLKAQGDYFFCQGINRFIFHTFVHQPWDDDVLPGMTMAVWGFQNNRNNTWYEQGRAWNEYLARSQYLLQEGKFQADLCYYAGENAPQTIKNRDALNPVPPPGYDYDMLSRGNLMKLTVQDGRLLLPGLMEYRLLVMPDGAVRPEALEKVAQLIRDGAHVVWKKPSGTPGLQDFPAANEEVQQACDALWQDCDGVSVKQIAHGKGTLYWPQPLANVLNKMGRAPDVEFQSMQPIAPTLVRSTGYEWIHRNAGGTDVYLVSNQQEVARQVEVTFRVSGARPQLWHPETGDVRATPLYQFTDDGRTRVKLFLQPAESVFVVFPASSSENVAASRPTIINVLHDGKLTFGAPAEPGPELVIHKATYGVPGGGAELQQDVTELLRSRVINNSLHEEVKTKLLGPDPFPGRRKVLRVEYSLGDERLTATAHPRETISINRNDEVTPASPQAATLSVTDRGVELSAWQPGQHELVYSDGSRRKVEVASIPEPLDLSKDWSLSCPEGWGPQQMTLDDLISWPDHSDPQLKYFSGTAVYEKQFDIPKDRLGESHVVQLDLGDVQVIAEVIINGKNLGIFWKPPFTMDVTGLLKPTGNRLEVRVTNLWINRLIGDEQFPATDVYIDGKKPGDALIKRIPDWLTSDQPRPETKRKSFVICRFYDADSPLVPSGLIGPVTLRFASVKNLPE
jgi:hypothetical protein